MDQKPNFAVWCISSTVAGLLLAGGVALVAKSNLWPLTAILGGVTGFIIGAAVGLVLKLLKVPMRYAWCIFGLLVASALGSFMYVKIYHAVGFGKLLEAEIVACEVAENLDTGNTLWKGAIYLTLDVSRERRLEKFQDWRIRLHEWRSANYTETYIMRTSDCGNLGSGQGIFVRSLNRSAGHTIVYPVRWDRDVISRDGQFIIDN